MDYTMYSGHSNIWNDQVLCCHILQCCLFYKVSSRHVSTKQNCYCPTYQANIFLQTLLNEELLTAELLSTLLYFIILLSYAVIFNDNNIIIRRLCTYVHTLTPFTTRFFNIQNSFHR